MMIDSAPVNGGPVNGGLVNGGLVNGGLVNDGLVNDGIVRREAMDRDLLDRFADLFTYPREDYAGRIAALRACAAGCSMLGENARAAVLARLDAFAAATRGFTLAEFEELYTRTFDINPVSSLEVGWHIYGEAYERGVFMVEMRETLRSVRVEESSELPDHITHVLAALGRMPAAAAFKLAAPKVQVAIEKMLAGFEGRDESYYDVLEALRIALDHFVQSYSEGTSSC